MLCCLKYEPKMFLSKKVIRRINRSEFRTHVRLFKIYLAGLHFPPHFDSKKKTQVALYRIIPKIVEPGTIIIGHKSHYLFEIAFDIRQKLF